VSDIFVLLAVASQTGRASATLSPNGSSVRSFDHLHMPELSGGNHALSAAAAEKNESSMMVDGLWQMTSDKPPVCSASLLLQSPYYDPHVAFTTRLTSSPLPYFAALPSAVYHFDCDHRQAEAVNSHPVSESSVTYSMPVPSDAVLVRPRMPLMAGKLVGCNETTSPPPSLVLLSPAVHDAGGSVSVESASTGSAATVYGGGFYAPPVVSHTDDAAAAATSLSCCPHCGAGFPAAAMQRNIVYNPTGPSYVIHSFSPTLQPCYSVTVCSGIVARPPAAAATYTAGALQSSVRLPDSVHQQTSTRPALSPHLPSASPGFINTALSGTGVRVRTARPPPSCANCGRIGHIQLDCKEPTIDTVLNTRTYITSSTHSADCIFLYYTVFQKNGHPFCFCYNFVYCQPSCIVFSTCTL